MPVLCGNDGGLWTGANGIGVGVSLPAPYYEDSAVKIFLGDCREILPLLDKVDLLLTDPPYGINGGSGTIGKSRAHKHSYLTFEDTLENIETIIIPAFVFALSIAKRGIVTPGPKAFQLYPKCESLGALIQPATSSLNMWGRASSQPVLYYGRPPRIGKDIGETTFTINDAASPGSDGHPCPKPLKVWKQLLLLGSEPGETVLDPFMGSGTTLRAAKDLGRKAIGIELEEKYCEIAANRMCQEVLL